MRNDHLVIDGLVISKWGRPVFEAMHAGGLAAANCTCNGVWDGFVASTQAMARWKAWFGLHGDLLHQVYRVDDIALARGQGKVGVILGWQNTSGFGDDLRMVPLFAELGLRVVQLTYHTANAVGSGCLESRDGGLTDFGREMVDALNANGLLIDLSHVGTLTADEASRASRRPVAYTHCAPRALKDHPRNKSDAEMRNVADRGGVVGVTMFPPFMPRGNESTLDDYLDAIEHVIGVCGEAAVALGSDFTQGLGDDDIAVLLHDKGHARELIRSPGPILNPPGLRTLDEYPNLTAAMQARGWTAGRIERVLGGNWMRLFAEVWK